jgi:hypothetical protein
MVLTPTYNLRMPCFQGLSYAGVAQLAEHNVANVVVVGSNPITRSVSGQAALA